MNGHTRSSAAGSGGAVRFGPDSVDIAINITRRRRSSVAARLRPTGGRKPLSAAGYAGG
ncbi:hypothetical protein I549_5624 [Mycobacterium avium subsp. avium 2285 (R)]|nr:hypothetical protein I549_5624 [Mycobacterium avium subsp. avium 2285 (R)]